MIRKQMTFYKWIVMNSHTFEPKEEDLATDIMLDVNFPKRSLNRDEIKNYLHNEWANTCMDCFDRLFTKYERRMIKHE